MTVDNNDRLWALLGGLSSKIDDTAEKQNDRHTQIMTAVTELQTQMKDLIGNGKPGRIKEIEDNVRDLFRFRWTWGGVIAALSAIASIVTGYFTHKH